MSIADLEILYWQELATSGGLPVPGGVGDADKVVGVNAGGTGFELETAGMSASLLDAQSILGAVTDNTPVAIVIGEQQVAGRITGGNVVGLTVVQLKTLLGVGAASGIASLDAGTTIPDAQIPSTIARDSEITTAINAVINAAPGALDTLDELAAALGDDANFASTVTTSLATKVDKATFDANTVLKADSDNTPVALTMGASTILARLAAGGIVAATPAELEALLTGLVTKALYDANTILAATTDNTPAALTMGASTTLARLAAGNIVAASVAQMQTLYDILTTAVAATTYLGLGGGTLTGALLVPDGAVGTPSITNTGDTNTGILFPGADAVAIAAGGTYIAQAQLIAGAPTWQLADGVAASPGLSFINDPDTGWYRVGADEMALVAGGVQTARFLTAAGAARVGLYSATPVVRAAAITAPTGGAIIDAEGRTAINAIRVALTNIGVTS